jgi:Tol biopolymer transport system component
LGNLNGHAGAWSPDGNRVAYANGNDVSSSSYVYIASKDGSDSRKLVSLEKRYVKSVRWSPDGNFLRMILWEDGGTTSLWEVSTYGTNLRRLTPAGVTDNVLEQSWTPDGRYSLLTAGTDIWVIREARSRLLDSTANAVRLTIGDMNFWHPTTSPDGRQIFAIGGQRRGELVRYDLRLQRLEPFLSGISVEGLDFSRDGKRVTYVTFPEGVLWRSNVDGSDRMQLTMHPLYAALPRWSPDGKRIAFTGWVPPEHGKIYTVSAEGGEPDVVSQGHINAGDATWSPDGNSLIFNQPGVYSAGSAPQIVSVDLQTGQVSNIPGSEGMFSPRLSPDGRFIVAMDIPHPSKLFLFDQQTQKWTNLLDSKLTSINWPQWSGDSRFVYVSEMMPGTQGFSLYRLAVANKKLERVAVVEVPDGLTGLWEHWVGVAPDGSPLLLRDRSIEEIYALAVDLP